MTRARRSYPGLMIVLSLIVWAAPLAAQERGSLGVDDGNAAAAPLVDVAKRVVLDPTTYVPATVLFVSLRLDWTSSQPLFQHGFVEGNARYTVSGYAHDTPVSYAAGNRRIAADALMSMTTMLVHNAANRTMERVLTDRFPAHRRLLKTIGWVERSAFASYLSYQLSAPHFRQWQANERLAGQLGY